MTDRHLLYAAAFLRALATAMVAVLVALSLAARGFDATEIGLVVGAGLAGAAVAALLVTMFGDRIGRRRLLVALALVGAAGGVGVAIAAPLELICVAALVGMLNGMGRDRGAALIIDQAVLPATADAARRTALFARYNICQDAGHALGAVAAGAPVVLGAALAIDDVAALRLGLFGYAGVLVATALLYARLSPLAETPPVARTTRLSPETREVVRRLCGLFGLDGLAGGFVTTSLLSLLLLQRFGISAAALGLLFFGARIANAGSHLAAAWLARRIGLVNTMVFTHIPSSLLLVTVAYAPTFPIAAVLFLLREGLAEMDVPTRQSYVMAVVRPDERTFVSGITHLVRVGSWAVAPAFAGLLMAESSLALPLVVGAAMKIAYDVLLYLAFRSRRPPEEQ
jgi:MFS family permease